MTPTQKFQAWLHLNRERFAQTGLAFAKIWIWVTVVLMVINLYALRAGAGGSDILQHLRDEALPIPLKSLFADPSAATTLLWTFLGSCVAAPLMEEYLRGAACQFCTDPATGSLKNPFILNSLSCIGFGLLHGGGYFSILVQGALGYVLGHLWFRNLRNRDSTFSTRWAYGCNVVVHAAYNFCVLGTQVLVVRTGLSPSP